MANEKSYRILAVFMAAGSLFVGFIGVEIHHKIKSYKEEIACVQDKLSAGVSRSNIVFVNGQCSVKTPM